MKVWLLEANAEPDFKQTGHRLQQVVETVIEASLALTVDQWAPPPPPAGGAATAEEEGEGGAAAARQPTKAEAAVERMVKVFSR